MLNKKEVTTIFRDMWTDAILNNESLKNDNIAKHEAFYCLVDSMVKNGDLKDRAMCWKYPWKKIWLNNRT